MARAGHVQDRAHCHWKDHLEQEQKATNALAILRMTKQTRKLQKVMMPCRKRLAHGTTLSSKQLPRHTQLTQSLVTVQADASRQGTRVRSSCLPESPHTGGHLILHSPKDDERCIMWD